MYILEMISGTAFVQTVTLQRLSNRLSLWSTEQKRGEYTCGD